MGPKTDPCGTPHWINEGVHVKLHGTADKLCAVIEIRREPLEYGTIQSVGDV